MNSQFKQSISDISEIDWNEVIRNKKETNPKTVNSGPEVWNKRAPSFADHAGKTFYPDSFIKIMNPDPTWTVLDMGCGGGTLAIPMAERVSHITAVDFSEKMLEILNTEAEKRGIKNISTIHASWEENWSDSGIGIYDVAIASRSLAVDDIDAALSKLNNAAKKRVIISTVAGDGPFDRKMLEAVGRERSAGVDYIYFYNLLYQMGIPANINLITEERNNTFGSIEEALESVRWMFQEMTPDEENRLEKYLSEHLVETEAGLTLNYRKHSTWAVIWWDK
ncbi:MAG TPA: class I SAM-dependent methyltransferase [Spirochaetota bacterium]|nr:class I SAM-dependent methyltransferase [Spirochaetota bacterium]